MNERSVPTIFSHQRRRHRWQRAAHLQRSKPDGARFIWADMIEDMIERLSFLRFEPQTSLVPWEPGCELEDFLIGCGGKVDRKPLVDMERPFAQSEYDFVGLIGQFDAINDLPGALIHIRNAVVPGGLAIASFVGGASLPRLRAAMMSADGDRPAARIHPMVDPRAVPQLLQRAGWKDPVVDTHTLTVRYASLDQLVSDLRDHGLTSALANAGPPLGKAAVERARAAFRASADPDGKTAETFEIITLTGRRSLAGT